MSSPDRFALVLLLVAALGCGGPRADTGSKTPQQAEGAERSSPQGRPAAAAPVSGRRLILIGWDGADWELLDSLRQQGQLPNLNRMISEGRSAVEHVFSPTISPMVWTTIATGAEPPEHGVLDFFEIDPGTGQEVPVSTRSVRLPPFWEVASARGETVGVVNYWASFPAAEVNGFLLSDRVSPPLTEADPAQRPSALFPPRERERVRKLLDAHPPADLEKLRRFGEFRDQDLAAHPAQMLAHSIRNTSTVQALAEDFYDRLMPQSLAVYFLGTDEVDHLYGQETAPRLPCVAPEAFTRFSQVVPRFYAWMDELLGRWMERAHRDGANLLLVSDHGFLWGNRRSCNINALEGKSAAASHRPEGIAVAWGADVVPRSDRTSLSVLDIEPTIAALLSLPVDRRAPGRAQNDWFARLSAVPREDLWTSFVRPRHLPYVAPSRDEYAQRLRSLGYLTGGQSGPSSGPRGQSRPEPTATGWLNLGNYWSGKGQRVEAVSAFRKAVAAWPGYAPAQVDLVASLALLGRKTEALAAAQNVLETSGEQRPWAVYEIAARLEAAGWIEEEERFLRTAAERLPSSEPVVVSLAGLRLGRGRCREALDLIRPFLNSSARADDWNVAGFALLCLGQEAEARKMLERSLAVNPNQPRVRAALSRRSS